jgi:hypothetical protein
VKNHVISAEIKSSEIGLGALLEKNALGDKLLLNSEELIPTSTSNQNSSSETLKPRTDIYT